MTKQILVVEDQAGTLKLIASMLEREGFNVLKAWDAYSALDVLDAFAPDLLVIDMTVSGTGGIELYRQVRTHPHVAQTPIIALTGSGNSKGAEEALRAGADDYQSKPILHHELLTKVRRALGLEEKGGPTPSRDNHVRLDASSIRWGNNEESG
jgi:DNA-binding response OmpR family regulator